MFRIHFHCIADSEHLILIKLEITGKKNKFHIGCFRKIWRFNLIVSEIFVQIITSFYFLFCFLFGFSVSLSVSFVFFLFCFCIFVLYCLFFLSPACTGMSLWTYLYRYEPQNSFLWHKPAYRCTIAVSPWAFIALICTRHDIDLSE